MVIQSYQLIPVCPVFSALAKADIFTLQTILSLYDAGRNLGYQKREPFGNLRIRTTETVWEKLDPSGL